MASRRTQEPPIYERTLDYPVAAKDAVDYLLHAIPKEVLEEFDARCQTASKSRRWTLITLMKRFGEGRIALEDSNART